ncbi:MAG: tRNA uracil 4-sulfurtransferase ThiI [Vicinamibacteria bacterium]
MQVLVHYHEIALKGRNRPFFVEKLADNLRAATRDLGGRCHSLAGRLLVEVPDSVPWELVRTRVASVFGVANYGRAFQVPPRMDELEAGALAAIEGRRFSSFRVTAKRADKRFALNSGEIERQLGGAIHLATGVRVDLRQPDLHVFVEVLRDRILHSVERLPGPGGFPVGSSGRVACLLSGGIDSPVAAWRMMKRGCTVALVHFHAFPLQDRTTIEKARELARALTRWQFRTRLVLVPFAAVQQRIVAEAPAPLRVVLYRRFMLRIAEALAPRLKAKALVTGESLGQVASQTLDNMATIDAVAGLPVLRPLVGMDKDEITDQARRLGTFETSTLPDQDCCQLFVPRSPATASKPAQARAAEAALDVRGLVGQAVRDATDERFSFPE